jgi:hypothetical protein
MALTSGSIPSLHNGVSQQSALVRSPEQCEAVTNAWLSLADGTGKRAPTEMVAKLMTSAPTNALIHEINRDVDERYVVVVASGVIRIFTLAGTEVSVAAPGGWGYLDGITDYAADTALYTAADFTFVVNRKKVCAMAELGADVSADGLFYVWPNPANGLDSNGDSFGPGQAYQYPPNAATGTFMGTIQSFTKLPATATNGDVYCIAGTDETAFRTYYVQRAGAVWNECRKPGLVNAIDSTTMPHALVRQPNGSFIFAPFSWAPRRVGDEDTNPAPLFIGRTIRRLFTYQNRLSFLSDENTILSVVGDLGNFWRMTVLDYIASDVISVSATSTKVSILVDAVAFNDGILLTSDQTQFSLSNGEDGASAANMAIRPVTSYEVNPRVGMVAMGSEVYFTSERNGSTVIREYARDSAGDNTSAAEITGHVPTYIPGGAHKLIPAVDLGALFTLTDGDPSAIYCYQVYWLSSTQKAQTAHHRWEMGAGNRVISAAYLSGFLYILIARADGLFLERMNLQSGAVAPGVAHQCLLDRRATVTGTYVPADDRTTLSLPYAPVQASFRIVRTTASGKALSVVDPTTHEWLNATTLKVPGNESTPVLVGQKYTFVYRFSPLYVRRNDGTAIATGRTQLRTFTVSYRNTGFFQTRVAPYGTDGVLEDVLPAKLSQFTGKVLGAGDLIINAPAFHTGDYSFSVLGQSDVATIELVNDTHVASTFVSAEWEAMFWKRS